MIDQNSGARVGPEEAVCLHGRVGRLEESAREFVARVSAITAEYCPPSERNGVRDRAEYARRDGDSRSCRRPAICS